MSAGRWRRFRAARLLPQGAPGLHLTLGALLLAAAVGLFGAIAAAVRDGAAMTQLDLRVALWFHDHAAGWLTPLMLLLTHLHSVAGVAVLGVLLGWYFRRKGARDWLLALAIGMPGGMLLNVLLKYVFTRARPSFEHPVAQLALSTYSFPSGHTMTATVLYGFIGAYLAAALPKRGARVAAVAGAVCMVLLVGLSRIYLGAHYLSDVLAAVAEGCAWLALCLTAAATLRRRAARHKESQADSDRRHS